MLCSYFGNSNHLLNLLYIFNIEYVLYIYIYMYTTVTKYVYTHKSRLLAHHLEISQPSWFLRKNTRTIQPSQSTSPSWRYSEIKFEKPQRFSLNYKLVWWVTYYHQMVQGGPLRSLWGEMGPPLQMAEKKHTVGSWGGKTLFTFFLPIL